MTINYAKAKTKKKKKYELQNVQGIKAVLAYKFVVRGIFRKPAFREHLQLHEAGSYRDGHGREARDKASRTTVVGGSRRRSSR